MIDAACNSIKFDKIMACGKFQMVLSKSGSGIERALDYSLSSLTIQT
jgi:hypothetical protein